MSNEYREYTESIVASGNYKGGHGLQSTKTATTVRVRNGKRQTTDGPFAETREQLAGYTSSTRPISTPPSRSPREFPARVPEPSRCAPSRK
jgi:hypothetical protein